MSKERATYNIKLDKKNKIERLAIEASMKLGRMVKWTEIMDILVSEFGKDAQAYLIHKEQEVSNDKQYGTEQTKSRFSQ